MELTSTLSNRDQSWDLEEQGALNSNPQVIKFLDKGDLANLREAIELYKASNSENDDLEAGTPLKSNNTRVDHKPEDNDLEVGLDNFSRQEPETKIHILKLTGFFLAMIVISVVLLITTKWKDAVSFTITTTITYLSYIALINVGWKARLLKEIWVETDDFYQLTDLVSCLIFLIISTFRLAKIIHSCYYSVFVFGLSLIAYSYMSVTPLKKQFWELLPRIFYFTQALLITLKTDGFITYPWMQVLIPTWICFGVLAALYVKSWLNLLSKLLRNQDSSKAFKINGLLWCLAYRISILSLFGVLAGFVEAQTSSLGFNFLHYSIYFALAVNIPVFIWTLLTRESLIRFSIKFELVHCYLMMYTPEEFAKFIDSQKTITFEAQDQKNYFVMISQTYFLRLTDKIISALSAAKQDDELIKTIVQLKGNNVDSSQDNEENKLCYVCYKNASNVVFTNCGHGGVCYECADISIKQKDECLQCREKIDAIHIIDKDQKSSNVIKTVQTYNVIKI